MFEEFCLLGEGILDFLLEGSTVTFDGLGLSDWVSCSSFNSLVLFEICYRVFTSALQGFFAQFTFLLDGLQWLFQAVQVKCLFLHSLVVSEQAA